jgi:hypothetical protein
MKVATSAIEHYWDDPGFQDQLISLLVHDHKSLARCASVLAADDFKLVKGVRSSRARWLIAERALDFFKKHHEPIAGLLNSEVLDYANELGFGAAQRGELDTYLQAFAKIKPVKADAIIEKVVKFKSYQLKTQALREMAELLAAHKLPDEKWIELTRKALAASNGSFETIPFLNLEQVTQRIARRNNARRGNKIPLTLIDPLDLIVTTIGPKQIGLALAPYKRGKSMFLEWLAIAYARQRLNVLHITLEDPIDVVEDRLDSIITNIPMKRLIVKPKTVDKRIARFLALVRSRIEIYDGTSQEMTIQKIEGVADTCRNHGFIPQVLLVDYDEKIRPTRNYEQKRFEMDDVYNTFQTLCSRMNLIGWLAAQTQRNTQHMKVLTGDTVAEDIGKMRKTTVGISLGKGEWTDESIYMFVAAHKNDKMNIGCEVVPDKSRGMIYDEEATRRAAAANATP